MRLQSSAHLRYLGNRIPRPSRPVLHAQANARWKREAEFFPLFDPSRIDRLSSTLSRVRE